MNQRSRWAAALLCPVLLLFCTAPLPIRAAAPGVSSLSAVVYEPVSGRILYEKDGHTARPMASTTKLMTALVAGTALAPEQTVQIPAGTVPVEGTQVGLSVGETATVRDLLAALLLSSGNDAANALALLTAGSFEGFAVRMNETAARLGMVDSHFVTPSGLDAEGHGASAADMARLGAAVLQVPLLAELCRSRTAAVTLGGRHCTLSNHNKLLRLCDGCIGLKTGFTKKSGRCLVSAVERNGVTLIVATLNGGDYWNDHMALYDYGFSLVRRVELPAAAPEDCPVAGGVCAAVPLVAQGDSAAVLIGDETLSSTVELPPFLWAPVERGQPVGRVIYTAGERVAATQTLTAAAAVAARPVPDFNARFCRHLKQLTDSLLG